MRGGRVGFWLTVLAVFVGFWDTVLSDQDGFGRMFTRGIRLVVPAVAISEQRLRQLLTNTN